MMEIIKSKDLTYFQAHIISCIEENGPLTRREFVEKLGNPRTTIYDNLVKLQKKKIVEKFSQNNGKRGRPKIYWKLKEEFKKKFEKNKRNPPYDCPYFYSNWNSDEYCKLYEDYCGYDEFTGCQEYNDMMGKGE